MAQQQEKRRSNVGQQGQQGRGKTRQGGQGQPQTGQRGQQGQAGQNRPGDNPRNREQEDVEIDDEMEDEEE